MPDATPTDPRLAIGGNNPPPFDVEVAERHADLKARVEALIREGKAIPEKIETQADHERAQKFALDARQLVTDIRASYDEEAKPLKEKTSVLEKYFLSRGLTGMIEPVTKDVARFAGDYLLRLEDERRKQAAAAAQAAADEAAARAAEAAALEQQGKHTEAGVKMEGALAQEEHASTLAARAQAPTKDLARTYTSIATSSLALAAKPVVNMDEIDLEKLRPYLRQEDVESAIRALIKARGFKAEQLLADPPALSITGLSFERVAAARTR